MRPSSQRRAVLVGEQDELAVTKPGGAAGVEEQHQRQQAPGLGLLRQQLDENGPEANRLAGQLALAHRSPR